MKIRVPHKTAIGSASIEPWRPCRQVNHTAMNIEKLASVAVRQIKAPTHSDSELLRLDAVVEEVAARAGRPEQKPLVKP